MTNKIRRFYKAADVAAIDGGFAVVLDGKPVRTPIGSQLRAPSQGLAEAMAAEWQAQGTTVEPASMPLTQLASTVLDRVGLNRAAIVDELLNYAATDLLCYRAEEPAELVERQANQWQPLLDWVRDRCGAVLAVTSGVIPVAQPAEALAALRQQVDLQDDWRLTALQSATAASGSLVLALALLEKRLSAEQVFFASQLDEFYQAELWGEDEEAEGRRERLRRDIAATDEFARLL